MLTYHENPEPNGRVWSYCEQRLLTITAATKRINANYRGVYKSFIRFYDDYMANFAMVNDENNKNNAVPLESYVSTGSSGTVYITQYNVETYFTHIVVASPNASKATVRKKISALNKILCNVENITAKPIEYTPTITASQSSKWDTYRTLIPLMLALTLIRVLRMSTLKRRLYA